MHRIILLCAVFCLSLATAARAEVAGSFGGVPFKPLVVMMWKGSEITGDDNVTVDTYDLSFNSTDDSVPRQTASITIAVPQGKLPDGRTFRSLENTKSANQPAAAKGVPEVQGWLLLDRDSGFSQSSSFDRPARVKVEFGKRKGTTISGTIDLMMPPGPDDKEGTKPSSLTGDFTAVIE
jgi:hypothetical protein